MFTVWRQISDRFEVKMTDNGLHLSILHIFSYLRIFVSPRMKISMKIYEKLRKKVNLWSTSCHAMLPADSLNIRRSLNILPPHRYKTSIKNFLTITCIISSCNGNAFYFILKKYHIVATLVREISSSLQLLSLIFIITEIHNFSRMSTTHKKTYNWSFM